LLKRGVYRHLLFNRDAPPRRVGGAADKKTNGPQGKISDEGGSKIVRRYEWETEKARCLLFRRLYALLTHDDVDSLVVNHSSWSCSCIGRWL